MEVHRKPRVPTAYNQAPVPGRTWRAVPAALSFEIRNHLVHIGGSEDRRLHGEREIWRVRLGKAVFTGYGTGTVYCAGGIEPELSFVYQQIDAAVRMGRPSWTP